MLVTSQLVEQREVGPRRVPYVRVAEPRLAGKRLDVVVLVVDDWAGCSRRVVDGDLTELIDALITADQAEKLREKDED